MPFVLQIPLEEVVSFLLFGIKLGLSLLVLEQLAQQQHSL
jgi:hypothetical protein